MPKQLDLNENPIDDTESVISEFCCKACFFAKNKECTCRCGGKYHGKGKAHMDVERLGETEEKKDV